MRIGEVSKATGLDVQTVRFYEREGLLRMPPRESNGYRRYAREHIERLAFIRHCRSLDMRLADIRRLLDLLDDPSAQCADADRLVERQLAMVRARMDSLRALERQLATLQSRCRTPRRAQACGILAELRQAADGAR